MLAVKLSWLREGLGVGHEPLDNHLNSIKTLKSCDHDTCEPLTRLSGKSVGSVLDGLPECFEPACKIHSHPSLHLLAHGETRVAWHDHHRRNDTEQAADGGRLVPMFCCTNGAPRCAASWLLALAPKCLSCAQGSQSQAGSGLGSKPASETDPQDVVPRKRLCSRAESVRRQRVEFAQG